MAPPPPCFLCRSLSFLVKLEQLDLGGNDLEVLVRRGLTGWRPEGGPREARAKGDSEQIQQQGAHQEGRRGELGMGPCSLLGMAQQEALPRSHYSLFFLAAGHSGGSA